MDTDLILWILQVLLALAFNLVLGVLALAVAIGRSVVAPF